MQTPPTLDVIGAADMMKVHPNRVLEMIGAGVLPAAKLGRAWVILTRDVLALIENQIIAQTAARMHIAGRRVRVTKDSPRGRSLSGSRSTQPPGNAPLKRR